LVTHTPPWHESAASQSPSVASPHDVPSAWPSHTVRLASGKVAAASGGGAASGSSGSAGSSTSCTRGSPQAGRANAATSSESRQHRLDTRMKPGSLRAVAAHSAAARRFPCHDSRGKRSCRQLPASGRHPRAPPSVCACTVAGRPRRHSRV
jgi:hypothetical protein